MMTKLFTGVVGCFFCVLFCSCNASVTQPRSEKMVDKQIQSLHEEIGELRRDIKLLNKDIRQVLVNVRIIKASGTGTTQVPPTRPIGALRPGEYETPLG